MFFGNKKSTESGTRDLREHEAQIARIREKLPLAAKTDKDREIFGARSHRYATNEPITPQQLEELEKRWGVTLPDDFVAFLVGIGDGGAGPYYGIYASSRLSPDPERIAQPSPLRASPASQDWMSSQSEEELDENLDDDAYDEAVANLLRGTLEFGTMGCANEMLLIVSGEHRGRVVYFSMEALKPFFVYEKNFLDWYERWLDEVIAGFEIDWFGTTLGGSERKLIETARMAEENRTRVEAFKALTRLPKPGEEAFRLAEESLRDPADEVRHWALTLLAKHAPELADPLLLHMLRGDRTEDRRTAVQLIHWYRKGAAEAFAQELLPLAPVESDPETARFIGYVLEAAGVEPLPLLLPAFRSPDAEIRKNAVWQAGKSGHKADYLDAFIEVLLHDPDPWVRHAAVQAMYGVPDLRLLPVYEQLLKDPPKNEYIPENIRHRLKEYRFRTRKKIESGVPADLTKVRSMLREIMEERG